MSSLERRSALINLKEVDGTKIALIMAALIKVHLRTRATPHTAVADLVVQLGKVTTIIKYHTRAQTKSTTRHRSRKSKPCKLPMTIFRKLKSVRFLSC